MSIKQEKGFITVSGFTSEDFLEDVIKSAKEGYEVIPNTSYMFGATKQVCMRLPEGSVQSVVAEAIEVLEDPSEEGQGVDESLISSFNGDKSKLEDYGKTFGIDLKKNKSFKNMVRDLKEFVE